MNIHFTSQDQTFRLLPRHGEPTSICEWLTQKTIKFLAFFPVYIMIVGILTTVTWIWIMPLIGGNG